MQLYKSERVSPWQTDGSFSERLHRHIQSTDERPTLDADVSDEGRSYDAFGRKWGFRAELPPDSNQESLNIGSTSGRGPAAGSMLMVSALPSSYPDAPGARVARPRTRVTLGSKEVRTGPQINLKLQPHELWPHP